MFWKGVIGYLPVNVAQGVVGLLTIVAFTRLLTPEQYGAYALGFALMSLAHTAIFTWAEAAMARFWAGEAGRGAGAAHMATLYRVWLVALPLLALAAVVVALWPFRAELKLAALAGLLTVLPRTLVKLVQERRRAAGEVRAAALLDIVQTVGGFLLGAGLAWLGLGAAAPLLGLAIAAGACLAFGLPGELRLLAGGRFEAARARDYAAYGAPVALSLILALVLSSTDRFLIAAFLDPAAVGVYHAGYSLANRALDVIFIWLGAAGGPALIVALERGGRDALRPAANEQAALMVVLTLPAAVGLALVAAPLSQIMVGPALAAGAAQVTPWIAASGFLAGITTHYLSQAFTLARRTRLLLVAMAVPALANLALNLILIPRLGLTGALVATLASYGLGAVAAWGLARGPLALPIPWRALAQAGLAAGAMALAVTALPALGGIAELALKAGVGAAVYGALACALDAAGLRTRAAQALRILRARAA